MKRSEMIEKLIPLMKSIPEFASDYHKVDIILGKLEREGMLPPETDWLSMEQMDTMYPNTDWRENEYPRKDVNEWEPEDEIT